MRPLPLLVAILVSACAPASPGSETGGPEQWLAGYLRIDTANPPGNEAPAAAYLAEILSDAGVEPRLLVSPGGRTSLYARLAAPRGAGSALALVHHLDVVPPGDGWSFEPFGGERRDGRLLGRGAIDAKSLGVAQLAAFLELARRPQELARDVVLLAVADEETGGAEGAAWLLESHPELFADVAAVWNEGGANRAVGGRALWWGVEVAQKRPLWLEVTARGRGGHGSTLDFWSAPHDLVRALAALLERPRRYRVTAAARQALAARAAFSGPAFSAMVERLDEVAAAGDAEVGRHPGLAGLLLDTVQVNVLTAGERVNVAPAEARARIDVRLLPDTDEEVFLAELEAALGPEVGVEVLLRAPPAPPSPTDHELFACLAATLEESAPVVPAFISGVTDSRHFRQRGIPAYGFSPFALGGAELATLHGADEAIPLDVFHAGVELMVGAVRSCAAR